MAAAWLVVYAVVSVVLCASVTEGMKKDFQEDTVQPNKEPELCFGCVKTPPTFDKEGHRGCRGLLPENTIPAMLRALELGVTTLEMDTVITADGQVLVSHEPYFNHDTTTKPDGTFVTLEEEQSLNIFRMNYTTTTQYDVGARGNPNFPLQTPLRAIKPLLGDLIVAVEAYARQINRTLPQYSIETKSLATTDDIFNPVPSVFVETLMKVVTAAYILDRLTVESFDFRTLQYLHRHYPHIRTAMLIEETDTSNLTVQLDALGFVPTTYSPHYSQATRELIGAVHGLGMKMLPWTVNSAMEITRLMADGVDGIITDYPDLFSKS